MLRLHLGRLLPLALVAPLLITARAHAAAPPRPLAEPDASRATKVARTFFDLLRTTPPKRVDTSFRGRHLTPQFNKREYSDRMPGSLPGGALVQHKPMAIGKNHAFVKGDFSHGKDRVSFVLFLRKAPTWKVDAIRTLALPGFVYQMRAELSGKKVLTAEEKRQVDETNRWFRSDEEMKRFFLAQKAQFDDAVRRLKSLPASGKLDAATLARLDVVFVDRASTPKGIVLFSLGGILDNSLGYLYAPTDDVPPVTDAEYFYIEKIAPHWYIYRTT